MFICCETTHMVCEPKRARKKTREGKKTRAKNRARASAVEIYARQQITSSKIIQIQTAYFDLETASKVVHIICLLNQIKKNEKSPR